MGDQTSFQSQMLIRMSLGANEQGFWPVLKPTECLGVFVDKLDSRFDSLDDVHRNRILDAMKWEDTRLQIFIAKCRLEDWQGTCLYEAKKTVEWALEEEEATQVKAAVRPASGRSSDRKDSNGVRGQE